MAEQTAPPMGAGLFLEDILPLRWRPAGADQGTGGLHVEEANADFLRVMSVLDERAPELPEQPPETAQALRHLELKIDLVLNMVGRILARHLDLPDPVRLKLGAQQLEWISPKGPKRDERVCVELFLRPDYPCPLLLSGKVISTARKGRETLTTVALEEPAPPVRDWLERTIFRHHRYLVAQSRRHALSGQDAG